MIQTINKEHITKLNAKAKFYQKRLFTRAVEMDKDFQVVTLEGTMTAKAKDFLAWDVNNNPYPIDREVFKKTYMIFSQKCTECTFSSSLQSEWTEHHVMTGH